MEKPPVEGHNPLPSLEWRPSLTVSLRQIHPSFESGEGNDVCPTLFCKFCRQMKLSGSSDTVWLIHSKPCLSREPVRRCECDSQSPGFPIPNETIELTRIQCEPEAGRREIKPGPRSVAGFDSHFIARNRNVSPETDPSEIWMVGNVSSGVPRMAKKVRAVVGG